MLHYELSTMLNFADYIATDFSTLMAESKNLVNYTF